MHPLEFTIFIAFLAVNPFFIRGGSRNAFRLWDVCWLAAAPYFAILAIGSFFPYVYPYERNLWLTVIFLAVVFIYVLILHGSFRFAPSDIADSNPSPLLWSRKPFRVGNPTLQSPNHGILPFFKLEPSRLSYGLALGSIGLLLIEFVLNPKVQMTSDLLQNREQFGSSSFIGTLGKLFSGAAILCLQVGYTQFLYDRDKASLVTRLRKFSLHLVPYLVLSAIYLISGNRQFVFLGIILVGLTYVYLRGLASLFRPFTFAMIAVLLTSGILYQFVRNKDSAGRQDEFLVNVVNVREKQWNPFRDSYTLNSAGMLFFTYYGIQFNVLSAVVEGKVKYDTPILGTFPILYRRLQGPFGLKDQALAMVETSDDMKAILGSFGGVWATMFASFYIEFGAVSLFVYSFTVAILLYTLRRLHRFYQSATILLIGCCAIIVFGIHYVVTSDNFGALYVVMLFTPGAIWLRKEFHA